MLEIRDVQFRYAAAGCGIHVPYREHPVAQHAHGAGTDPVASTAMPSSHTRDE